MIIIRYRKKPAREIKKIIQNISSVVGQHSSSTAAAQSVRLSEATVSDLIVIQ